MNIKSFMNKVFHGIIIGLFLPIPIGCFLILCMLWKMWIDSFYLYGFPSDPISMMGAIYILIVMNVSVGACIGISTMTLWIIVKGEEAK